MYNRTSNDEVSENEYSRSILEADPLEALSEVGWNREKFLKRGGIYDW